MEFVSQAKTRFVWWKGNSNFLSNHTILPFKIELPQMDAVQGTNQTEFVGVKDFTKSYHDFSMTENSVCVSNEEMRHMGKFYKTTLLLFAL